MEYRIDIVQMDTKKGRMFQGIVTDADGNHLFGSFLQDSEHEARRYAQNFVSNERIDVLVVENNRLRDRVEVLRRVLWHIAHDYRGLGIEFDETAVALMGMANEALAPEFEETDLSIK